MHQGQLILNVSLRHADDLMPSQEAIKQIADNPSLLAGFDDPEVMQAVHDVAQNPANIHKYKNNKKVQASSAAAWRLISIMQHIWNCQPCTSGMIACKAYRAYRCEGWRLCRGQVCQGSVALGLNTACLFAMWCMLSGCMKACNYNPEALSPWCLNHR